MTLILAIPYLIVAAFLLLRYTGRRMEADMAAIHAAQQKARVRQIRRAWKSIQGGSAVVVR